MKKTTILVVLIAAGYFLLKDNPDILGITQLIPAQSAVLLSEAQINQSQSALQYAQAAQINQAVRRQNEMDDGIAVNVGARVLTGRGITDAQQFASGVFGSMCAVPVLMFLAVAVGWFTFRKRG